MVGVEVERALVGTLLADAEEALDGAAIVGSADPRVAGAELELRGLGRCLDRVECGEEGCGVDAVAHRLIDRASSWFRSPFGVVLRGRAGLVVRLTLRQAAAYSRSPGTGRAATSAASRSIAALSRFCSSTNSGTGG